MSDAPQHNWPDAFTRTHGRPPRVLHIGNIANNAYLNAKLLNAAGVESDVLCYGYYQLMGFPEWEEVDFEGPPLDENRPDWRTVNLKGFDRPRWFAQGPFLRSAAYLEARRGGSKMAADAQWRLLTLRRGMTCGSRWSAVRTMRDTLRRRFASVERSTAEPLAGGLSLQEVRSEHDDLVARFARVFPARHDRLSDADIAEYGRDHGWSPVGLRRLFASYDIVHGYGAEPILPLLSGTRPYVAFEHGTIRVLPFESSPVGRLTALAYHDADAVVITNADNRRAAERLGITGYRFVPHPVSEYRPNRDAVAALRARLLRQLAADFLVFHPSRHHWSPDRHPHWEKANDRLIDGLGIFFAAHPRAAAVFVDWGRTVDESRRLLAERGIADRVLWLPPQPGPSFARHMAAADVVADQFYLGAFGGITPRALFLGRPAMLHLDEEAHRWCLPEMPPVINAQGPREVADGLAAAYDRPDWVAELGQRGRQWYGAHHSNDVVVGRLTALYCAVWAARSRARGDAACVTTQMS